MLKNNNILIIAALLVMFVITGCDGGKDNSKGKSTVLSVKSTGSQKVDSLIAVLKTSMEDYMNDKDPSYSQNDIDQCIALLTDYTIKILSTGSKKEAMEIVKSTVLKLNELNKKCDFFLIETNEREQIVEIIILASSEMGYNTVDEDITEEWREW